MCWSGNWWKTLCAALPRGVAIFLGLFTLLNVVGEFLTPGFDANLWWINLPGNRSLLEQSLLLWSAACFLWFGTHHNLSRVAKVVMFFTFGTLLAASASNSVTYFRLLHDGRIHSTCLFPFSAIVALCLSTFLYETWRTRRDIKISSTKLHHLTAAITCLSCALMFPLAQMACFGKTDYRRKADVIVVFGARVHENGRVSSILEERVRTGCELYHQGLATHILFSGGPGVGEVHEAEGMRRRALELGVPASAILMDLNGNDTESTATNTIRIAQSQNWSRILAVSQCYHLPRIKLSFHRQGSEVYTVPAKQIYYFRYLPFFMLREIPAWWLYYVRPLF